ncbi:MAG: restriction endonuclease subunit S [Gemmataceae bacterium]
MSATSRRHKLGELLRRHNEIIHPGDRTGEAVFVGLEHIEANTGRRIGSAMIDLGKMTGRKPTFRAGQIVYGYLRPYLNKVWVAEFDGCSSVDQFAFDVRGELACTGYIAAFMRSELFLQRAAHATTTGQLPRISVEEIAAVEIELPPLAEQERIAAVLTSALSAVDRARQATDERLAAAEALPAAYLREVFEGPDADGWEVASLNAIAAIGGGIQKTPARAPNAHHRPYLTVRNVQRGYLDLTQTERFELTPAELERLRLQRGDILIVEGNGSVDHIGRNAVFNLDGEEWIHQNHIIRVRLDRSRAESEFVALYLNSDAGKRQMVEKARSTSGLFTLSVDKVGSLAVPIPPLAEQYRIAAELGARLGAAEAVAARCREEVAAVSALPAALLREAFGSTPNDSQP